MAKKPGERHSATNRDPVTIDLEGEDVRRLEDSETGNDGAAAEAAEPTPMDADDVPGRDSIDEPAREPEDAAIADETADLSDAEPDTNEVVTAEAGNDSNVADQTAAFEEPLPGPATTDVTSPEPVTGSDETADDVSPAETGPSSEPPPPPPVGREPQGGGMGAFGAFLLGAILVALGLGSAVWLGYVPVAGEGSGANNAQVAGLRQEVEALRSQVADVQNTDGGVTPEDLATLRDQVQQLRDSVSSGNAGDAPALQALANRVEALEAGPSEGDGADARQAIETAGQQTRQLAERLNEMETRLASLQQTASERQDATRQTRQSLSEFDQQFATISQTISDLRDSVASLTERVATLSSRLDEVRKTAEGNRAQENVARAIAASALRSAVEGGRSYRNELQTARALGADGAAVETLSQYAETGVKTPAELAARAPAVADAMRDALAPRSPTETTGGLLDQLTAGARSLVTIRRQGELNGESPASAITRFENAVRNGDLEKALADYHSLPPEVQEAGQSFASDLRATAAAEASLPKVLSAVGQAGRAAPDGGSEPSVDGQDQPASSTGDAAPAAATDETITPGTEQ